MNKWRVQPIRIIEIIGPAGVGKSSLGKILAQSPQIKWIQMPPYFRKVADLPFFIMNSFLMVRTFVGFYVNKKGKWFTPEQIAWLVILNGWCFKLRRLAKKSNTSLVIDEGPIFHLAYLNMRGPEVLRSSFAESWWQKMYKQVTGTTDLIVWLDASNEVLLHRIRTRENSKLFGSETDEQVMHFVDELRKSYMDLMSCFMTQKSNLQVLTFNTEEAPLDEISEHVLAVVNNNSK